MRVSFSSFQNYSIAEAEIIGTEMIGVGGIIAPQLWLPLRITLSHGAMKPGDGLDVVSLTGKLFANNGPLSNSTQVNIGIILFRGHDAFRDQIHNLEFPLDSCRIAALEKLRSGGDLKLRLDAVLSINKLHALNQRPPDQPLAEIVWGYVGPYKLYLQTELTISRDAWISRVLPNVGHGVIHVIELPAVPLEACASLDHAFKALQQAQELHKIGLYDEAVGKCRVALDKFFEYEERTSDGGKTNRVPVLIKSWETRVGKATYDWLNSTLGALKRAANPPHHSPQQHFSQFESQMIVAITAAMVTYAVRTGC